MNNRALVFVKPHASHSDDCYAFVKKHLREHDIRILEEGEKNAEEIKANELVDKHYAALAENAMKKSPRELAENAVDETKKQEFADKFGVGWEEAIAKGKLINLGTLMENHKSLSAEVISKEWKSNPALKLAPGTYVAQFKTRVDGVDVDYLVINGFYAKMRGAFVEDNARVRWLLCEFNPQSVSWAHFRGKVIGATDPTKAEKGSLREKLLKAYKDVGLTTEPNMTENCVHASAGPVEASREIRYWVGEKQATEEGSFVSNFFKQLGNGKREQDLLSKLENNVSITIGEETGPAFDLFEDKNTEEVIQLLQGAKL